MFNPTLTFVAHANADECRVKAKGFMGETEMVFPMSEDEFIRRHNEWKRGKTIQVAFGNLDATHREFIQTGMTPKDQESVFTPDDAMTDWWNEYD
jgi:hypothetical protein